MNESRSFKIDPHLIFDVISKQSGSVSKAIAEGAMNSVDAGATKCHIDLSIDDFTIRDDGKGFVGRNEIEKFFETFGTPHVEGDARFGKFRMGRGQILSFGHNRWRSGVFSMDVDIKNRGLDYTLRETPDDLQPGCSIEVDLYERLCPTDLDGTVREVKELLAYFPIPVFLNGMLISKDRSSVKWDHEDEKCLIAFRESGPIKLYNLGMFVHAYSPGQYGGNSAIVVSKEQIAVNFARTDVLVNQCDVWRHIRKVLDRYSNTRGEKKLRLTSEDRQYRLRKFLTGQITYAAFREEKVIPVFPSGYTTLASLVDSCSYRTKPLVVLMPGDNERIAEAVVRGERARVLRSEILDWCNVDDAQALVQSFIEGASHPGNEEWHLKRVRGLKFASLKSVSTGICDGHTLIHSKELTSIERSALVGLRAASTAVRRSMRSADDLFEFPKDREMRIGLSDSALAWTDGASFIAFDRKFLNESVKSLGGIGGLVGTCLHEFLHDEDDTSSHIHDGAFYERFHNLILGATLDAQRDFLRAFHTSTRSLKAKIPAGLRRDLDIVFAISEASAESEHSDRDDAAA